MLFLIEDEGMTLRGKMAIGAQTREEAEATWRALGEEADRAQKIGKDILEALLDQAEAFSIAVADGREHDQPLSMAVQSVYMPIEEEAGAPAVCVLKGQAIVVQNAQPDPFRTVVERITQPGDMGHAFVCVPLVGKEGAIGALVVDNRFLASEREIDEDAISCLEAFAGMMAMSVENARLQARLAEEERLKTWKDFTAQIAHTIGTRIGVIEGWVTMLRSHLLEEKAVKVRQVKNTRALLEKLFDGILKAKEVLNEFRTFTVPLQLQSEELDLVQLLEAVVREIQHNVKFPIVPSLPSEPLIILGDPTRLSDAFIELIKNAQEAMQQDAGRAPQITITASVETAPATPGNVARVEFANTGPGIPEAHKERIFDPYFSTKGTGSGLGLTIVRKIIEEHQGTIEEVGDLEEGARFVVRLTIVEPSPCLEQGGGGNGQDPRSGR
jgi:signal transduction histidine kinase